MAGFQAPNAYARPVGAAPLWQGQGAGHHASALAAPTYPPAAAAPVAAPASYGVPAYGGSSAAAAAAAAPLHGPAYAHGVYGTPASARGPLYPSVGSAAGGAHASAEAWGAGDVPLYGRPALEGATSAHAAPGAGAATGASSTAPAAAEASAAPRRHVYARGAASAAAGAAVAGTNGHARATAPSAASAATAAAGGSREAADNIEALYPKAKQLGHDIEYQLQQLESHAHAHAPPPGATDGMDGHDLKNEVSQNVNRLAHMIQQLEAAAARTMGPRRSLWRSRVTELAAKAQSQRKTVERYLSKEFTRAREERDREELFAGANAAAHAVVVDQYMKENASLSRSTRMVDDLIGTGTATRSALLDQESTLKRAHRKALDMAQSLGLSNSIMRVIERRTTGDRVLVYSGMVVVMLILYWAFWWSGSSGADTATVEAAAGAGAGSGVGD